MILLYAEFERSVNEANKCESVHVSHFDYSNSLSMPVILLHISNQQYVH